MKGITSRSLVAFSLVGLLAASSFGLTGCGRAGVAGAQASDFSSIDMGGEQAGSLVIPLRISRVFFANTLQANIKLSESSGNTARTVPSNIDWYEGEPRGPAPQPGYIADFRDRPGCVVLKGISSSSGSSEICFNIVPDVDSVDITSEKVQFRFASDNLDPSCDPNTQAVQLKNAEKVSEHQLLLHFELPANSQCAVKQVSVELFY